MRTPQEIARGIMEACCVSRDGIEAMIISAIEAERYPRPRAKKEPQEIAREPQEIARELVDRKTIDPGFAGPGDVSCPKYGLISAITEAIEHAEERGATWALEEVADLNSNMWHIDCGSHECCEGVVEMRLKDIRPRLVVEVARKRPPTGA